MSARVRAILALVLMLAVAVVFGFTAFRTMLPPGPLASPVARPAILVGAALAAALSLTSSVFLLLPAISLVLGLAAFRSVLHSGLLGGADARLVILVAVGYLALATVLSLGASATVRRRAVIGSVAAALLFVGAAAVASGTAVQLLAALLILITAFGVGTALLALLPVETEFSAWERVALGAGLGLGVLSHLTVVLGLFGALYPAVALALLVALLALTHRFLMRSAGGIWRETRSLLMERAPDHLLLFAVLLVFLSLAAVQAMAPPIEWDDLMYHLWVPQQYVAGHRLAAFPDVAQSFFYQGVEMLHTLAFLLGGEATAITLNVVLGLLTALALGGFAGRIFSRQAAWLSAVFWTTTPLVAWSMPTGHSDLSPAFFSFLSAIAGYACVRRPDWRTGLLAGILGGFAFSSKLHAAASILALICVLMLVLWVSRRLGDSLRLAAAYAAGLAATGFVWPLLRFVETGNPVYPFLNAIFRAPGYPPVNQWFNFLHWGMGKSFSALLALPWNVTFHGDRFWEAPHPYALGPWALLAAIACILILPRIKGELGWSISVASLFVGAWFLGVQNLRYLMPVWPLVTLIAAVSLARLLVPISPFLRRATVAIFCGVVCSASLVWGLALDNIPEGVPFRVIFGVESRTSYLTRTVAAYPAFQAVGKACESPAPTVLSIGNMFQYLCPKMIAWTAPRASFVSQAGTDAFYSEALRKLGIRYVIVDDNMEWASPTPFVASGFLVRASELLHFARRTEAFRILGPGERPTRHFVRAQQQPEGSPYRPGLLEPLDPAFERAAGALSRWTPGRVSPPTLDVGSDTLRYPAASEGKGALHISLLGPSDGRDAETAAAAFPKAAVEVSPGGTYVFSYDLLCSGLIDAPLVRLRFTDSGGSEAGSIEVLTNTACDTRWRRFRATITAPAGAAGLYPEFGCTFRGKFFYARFLELDRLGLERVPQ